MSTNNNLLGKEIRPIWIESQGSSQPAMKLGKLSGQSLQRRMKNNLEDCSGMPLSGCGITKIEDLRGLGEKLRRLDLSNNQLTRLNGFAVIPRLSLLNIAANAFLGDSGLGELRYLTELRTLNIGKNPQIKNIRSHILKNLVHLQALIRNECGLEKASFIRFFPQLNTLVLSHNNITNLNLHEMNLDFKFTHLTKISLGHNSLDVMPKFFPWMPSLEEIKVNHNRITDISEEFISFYSKKLKTFDISHNAITDWKIIERLVGLLSLTNLAAKGNPLSPLPESVDKLYIKEDISSSLILDIQDKRYRINTLNIFQRLVGKNQKHFIQLVVLDNHRVKTKWTQGGAKNQSDDEEEESKEPKIGLTANKASDLSEERNINDRTNKKRKHESTDSIVRSSHVIARSAVTAAEATDIVPLQKHSKSDIPKNERKQKSSESLEVRSSNGRSDSESVVKAIQHNISVASKESTEVSEIHSKGKKKAKRLETKESIKNTFSEHDIAEDDSIDLKDIAIDRNRTVSVIDAASNPQISGVVAVIANKTDNKKSKKPKDNNSSEINIRPNADPQLIISALKNDNRLQQIGGGGSSAWD